MSLTERPKLFDGPSPEGQAGVRSMDRIAAPFLTKVGKGNVAYKCGEFRRVEIQTTQDLAYLFCSVSPKPALAWTSSPTPTLAIAEYLQAEDPAVKASATSAQPAPLRMGPGGCTHIGGGAVLFYQSDATAYAALNSYNGVPLRLVPDGPSGLIGTDHQMWPVVTQVFTPGTEGTPPIKNPDTKALESTTFLNSLVMTGQPYAVGPRALALGKRAGAYVFGGSYSQTVGNGYRLLAVYGGDYFRLNSGYQSHSVWVASTSSAGVSLPSLPARPGREMSPFNLGVTGHGKAAYLQFTLDVNPNDPNRQFSTAADLSRQSAWIVTTDDFGDTFQATEVPEFDALVEPYPGLGSGAAIYRDGHAWMMGKKSQFFYVGQGKSMLYVPAASTTRLQPGKPFSDSPRTWAQLNSENRLSPCATPALFIGQGSSYTRVAWPADDWYVNFAGAAIGHFQLRTPYLDIASMHWTSEPYQQPPESTLNPNFINPTPDLYDPRTIARNLKMASAPAYSHELAWAYQDGEQATQWCCGEGCVFVAVYTIADGSWNIMSTRDFGATWTLTPLPRALYPLSLRGPTFSVVSPYKANGSKGQVLITHRLPGTRKVAIYSTNGEFTSFSKLGDSEVLPDGQVFPTTEVFGYTADCSLYLGTSDDIASVMPAFPGEFDKDPT